MSARIPRRARSSGTILHEDSRWGMPSVRYVTVQRLYLHTTCGRQRTYEFRPVGAVEL